MSRNFSSMAWNPTRWCSGYCGGKQKSKQECIREQEVERKEQEIERKKQEIE
jgi:hypothetical protein